MFDEDFKKATLATIFASIIMLVFSGLTFVGSIYGIIWILRYFSII